MMSNSDTTQSQLQAGDHDYRAFVGPPERYDIMSASQLSLLFLLGLREGHQLLDFGCGSLRLGRLLIPFLNPGGYFGVEPERWLVDEGFNKELGEDARKVKRPRFDFNRECRCDGFGERFDFVIAQSIFSHMGWVLGVKALRNMAAVLKPSGLIVANWFVNEAADADVSSEEWLYPDCIPFSTIDLTNLFAQTGLHARRCGWPHAGRLTWFVLSNNESSLPDQSDLDRLTIQPLIHS
jgi:SAM-dependent methyltransferase